MTPPLWSLTKVRSRGFTLLEVVLAIGLAGVVLGLLGTAINLYLVRVDASRTQVESAQLARTLMQQIAGDLRAARYYEPVFASSAGPGESSEQSSPVDPSLVQGVFGTPTELRIDRSAIWQWEQVARQTNVENPETAVMTSPDQTVMPQTVRYVLGDGKELLAAKLAETGVTEQKLARGYAGLYRERISTAAWMASAASGETTFGTGDTETAALVAPEVVDIKFAYFDGEQFVDEWDSGTQRALPDAVEIRLTLLKEPFEQAVKRTATERDELRSSKENLVEYRLLVSLPKIDQVAEASFPQTTN